jgi:hypothetical protein
LIRPPPSPQMYGALEASGSEGSSDDEDVEASRMMNDAEGNFHDAANDLHEDNEEDAERALSGTLSESSGNLGSDVFDYKVKFDVTIGENVLEWFYLGCQLLLSFDIALLCHCSTLNI